MSEQLLVLMEGGPKGTEIIDGREWRVTPSGGREFAVVRDDDGHAVEVAGQRVGALAGEASTFVIDLDGVPHVLVAGVSDADRVEVQQPLEPPQTCRVKNGVWMAFPRPFTPGSPITVTFDGRRSKRLKAS